jgi:hypothetical protein
MTSRQALIRLFLALAALGAGAAAIVIVALLVRDTIG